MPQGKEVRLGQAWLALCLALALHITDEALTGFLSVYNPTVLEMRRRYPWFPMPAFGFEEWLAGLIALVIVLLCLAPLFFRNVRWVRPIGYFMAIINILNALGHTTATIFGQTVSTVRLPRPAPGFYSSPLLLAAALWLSVELIRTQPGHRAMRAAQNP